MITFTYELDGCSLPEVELGHILTLAMLAGHVVPRSIQVEKSGPDGLGQLMKPVR